MGGAEFRLPVLTGVLGYRPRQAVAVNLAVSLIAVVAAATVRGSTLSWRPVVELLPMGVGSIIGAVIGGLLIGLVADSVLKIVLGVILIISAARVFRH